jgi:tRNA-specific 2-thiouridylase
MKTKVYVGLSGGVDSAVTTALLIEQGYDVTGVFMKNWAGDDYGIADQCPWKRDLEDSQDICKHLGIDHKVYNFEKEYRELVINNFFSEYRAGHTPNPDVLCNKFIKFDLFMKRALSEGADFIATGHYSMTENGQLFKAKDTNKDQTYFLYQLTKNQLLKSTFPLAVITKAEVRVLAKKFKIPVAEKKDSQGICFVGKVDVNKFLKEELPINNGDFVDLVTKKIVGKHEGHWFYTVGQRKGLRIGGTALPYYVCSKDVTNNIVYLVQGKSHNELLKNELKVLDFHLIDSDEDVTVLKNLTATIRYRTPDTPINIVFSKNNSLNVRISFIESIWAPAIGQSVVVFDGKRCVGGGVITNID